MQSFVDRNRIFDGQPADIGVLLQRVDVGRGREELHRDQAPQLLKQLAEQTRVESIRASGAIEGVDVPTARAARLAATDNPNFRNRNEREFAGYRDATDYVMRLDPLEFPSVGLALHLHRLLYRHTDGRGGYLKQEDNLISHRDDRGHRHIVFEPVSFRETPFFIEELMERYEEACKSNAAHPLVLLAAFVVDFLAIHPVLDGNGRVVRLLTAHELVRLDYGVARYVSVEQRVWETKNSYYAALRQSQEGWHDAKHSIWPWTRYLLEVLSESYRDFEVRVAAAGGGASKQDRTREYIIGTAPARFRFRDLKAALPGISDPTLRLVLNKLKDDGVVHPEGKGAGAIWVKSGG